MNAVEKGDFEAADRLIAGGEDVNAAFGECETQLEVAAARGNAKGVRYLISKGADINLKTGHPSRALRGAAWKNHLDCVQEILSHFHDKKARETAMVNAFVTAASGGAMDVVKALIEMKVDVNAHADERPWTYNRFTALQLVLSDAGGPDKVNFDMADFLIEHGVDVNTHIRYLLWETCLTHASASGQTEVVKYLIAKGAHFDRETGSPCHAIQEAASHSRLECVEEILSHFESEKARKTAMANAWVAAASKEGFKSENRLEILKALADMEVDVNARNADGKTALQVASEPEVVEYLKSVGAKK